MKKIAIFQTDLNYGGIQKSLINLLNTIDYKKYEIDLYLMEKNNVFIEDVNKNVHIFYLKKMPYFTRCIPFLLLKKFYKKQTNKTYDIAIDFNSYSMDTALATVFVDAKDKISWIHNDVIMEMRYELFSLVLNIFFKSKYKFFDKFVAVSDGALASFKKVYKKLKQKEYYVIPNLINTEEIFLKSKEKNKLAIDKNVYNLCSMGRFRRQKGFDILIKDIKKLVEEKKNFHLYILGNGRNKIFYENQIRRYKLKDYISLVGYVKNPYAIMKDMDGFVLTSRYEGQGMVFLEAKCLGLEVVMPKHLEKYIDNVKGTTNVVKSLSKLKKKEKKIDDLKEYNKDIITKINDLFNS